MSSEPGPTTAPDFTEDERKWIAQHPFWRVVFMVMRLALVPIMLAAITAYFEYRTGHNEKKTDETYKAVAPAVNDTQEQVKALQKQVDLLQALVVALAQNGKPATVASAPPPPQPAAGLGNLGTIGHGAGTAVPVLGRMAVTIKEMEAVLAAAQKRKDVVVVSCVIEKLRQGKVALDTAQKTTDEDKQKRFNRELVRMATEAEMCVGAEAAFKPLTKATLVERLQQAPRRVFAPKALPASANDAVQQMSK